MNIVALSGKKGSGKDSIANYILGTYMKTLGLIVGNFHLTEEGKLYIDDLLGNKDLEGVFDIEAKRVGKYRLMNEFLNESVFPYIKIYSFADPLKKMCMEILGLTYEQCYGTNEEKNSFTTLKWENMPGIVHEPGFMTARDVLQFVGSDLFRKMYYDVWVDATMRQIKVDKPLLAIIKDCRFPNEVEGTHKENGFVIRLTRNIYKDEHHSEHELDENKYDWKNFNAILYNEDIGLEEQGQMTVEILNKWELLP